MGGPSLWAMLPSRVISVDNIAKFCRHLKTYIYNVAFTTLRINQSDNNWVCLLTLRSINLSVLMRL